jgi:hypothetical protein
MMPEPPTSVPAVDELLEWLTALEKDLATQESDIQSTSQVAALRTLLEQRREILWHVQTSAFGDVVCAACGTRYNQAEWAARQDALKYLDSVSERETNG